MRVHLYECLLQQYHANAELSLFVLDPCFVLFSVSFQFCTVFECIEYWYIASAQRARFEMFFSRYFAYEYMRKAKTFSTFHHHHHTVDIMDWHTILICMQLPTLWTREKRKTIFIWIIIEDRIQFFSLFFWWKYFSKYLPKDLLSLSFWFILVSSIHFMQINEIFFLYFHQQTKNNLFASCRIHHGRIVNSGFICRWNGRHDKAVGQIADHLPHHSPKGFATFSMLLRSFQFRSSFIRVQFTHLLG